MHRPSVLIGCSLGLMMSASTVRAFPATPLTTTRVASGLLEPDFVTAPPGDTSRLFIVEQQVPGAQGRIRVLDISGIPTLLGTPFLTTTGQGIGNEEGLLGLAFHPSFFAANPNPNRGAFFIYITQGGNNHIFRYTTTGQDPNANTADAASVQRVITFNHPGASNHNGGWIAFGPDNQLYAATGDGGGACDSAGNAQNINSYLGKMHRLNVDADQNVGDTTFWGYTSPAGNPFIGVGGLDEIWLYGLRNPWRNSFDRLTGALLIADVGQGAREEVNYVPAGASNINYGWDQREGFVCSNASGCSSTCTTLGMTDPIWDYPHDGRCSISGGYVYRGSKISDLQGTYFFADYCTAQIYSFVPNGTTPIPALQVTDRTAELAPGGGLSISTITSFGEDASGEMYICDQGGEVFKIIVNCAGSSLSFLSEPPPNSNAMACSSKVYTVVVNGLRGTVTYVWRKGGVPIPGAPNGPTLTIDPVRLSDAGFYDVVVTDQCGTITSAGTNFTVDPSTLPAGDIEGDCDTDAADIDILVNVLLGIDTDPGHIDRSDVNNDGTVNAHDVEAYTDLVIL